MKSNLLGIVCVLFFSSMAFGQTCRNTVCVPNNGRIVLRNNLHNVFVQERFSFFVGAPLVEQRYTIQKVQDLKDYKEYLEFKQWKVQKQKVQKVQTTKSYLVTNCSSCHSGGEPDGGLVIDTKSTFTSNQYAKLSKWMTGKVKPPAKMAKIVEKVRNDKNALLGKIIDEFLDRVK